jgi:hypothetical protein
MKLLHSTYRHGRLTVTVQHQPDLHGRYGAAWYGAGGRHGALSADTPEQAVQLAVEAIDERYGATDA